MAKVDNTTKRFWNKAIVSFLKYYPVRIKNVGLEQEVARRIVWDFKDGKAHEEVAQMTAKHLKDMFGDRIKDIVFSCVPASSTEKNELRYKDFSARVCELSGAVDGYQHISITGERLTVHEHRKDKEKTVSKVKIIDFDETFFKGKDVLCFDDILTTGNSWAAYGSQLEQLGANIVGGFFLGKTTYKII